MRVRRRMVVVGCALFAAACGGDDEGGSCGVEPCGGDVVGTWDVDGVCVNEAVIEEGVEMSDCGISQSLSTEASGSLTFNANGTYSVALTQTFDSTLRVPRACLSANGVTATCAQLDASFQNQIAMPDSPFQAVSCANADGGCRCALEGIPQVSEETGTYSADGNVITTTVAGAIEPQDGEYCVRGDTLHVLSRAENGAIAADLTATRR